MRYEIWLAGRLPGNWTDWFAGFDRRLLENGDSLLTGPLPDQAALAGLLGSICQMNLTLISVKQLADDRTQKTGGF